MMGNNWKMEGEKLPERNKGTEKTIPGQITGEEFEERIQKVFSTEELVTLLESVENISGGGSDHNRYSYTGEQIADAIRNEEFDQIPEGLGIKEAALELKETEYFKNQLMAADNWKVFFDAVLLLKNIEVHGEDDEGEYVDELSQKEIETFLLSTLDVDNISYIRERTYLDNVITEGLGMLQKMEELFEKHGKPSSDDRKYLIKRIMDNYPNSKEGVQEDEIIKVTPQKMENRRGIFVEEEASLTKLQFEIKKIIINLKLRLWAFIPTIKSNDPIYPQIKRFEGQFLDRREEADNRGDENTVQKLDELSGKIAGLCRQYLKTRRPHKKSEIMTEIEESIETVE
jgi:hypothetical protein